MDIWSVYGLVLSIVLSATLISMLVILFIDSRKL